MAVHRIGNKIKSFQWDEVDPDMAPVVRVIQISKGWHILRDVEKKAVWHPSAPEYP
jgi:hypothetical protein